MEKIIHSLKLTYSEQQQLYDAYEIADEVYNQSEPSLSLSLPMETDFLNLFFSEIYNTDFNKIQIRQLLYLLKNPACENRKTYNLEVLSNVLPLALRKPSGYHVYYTYTDSIPTAETLSGFPYYILFTKYVLLLSPDLDTSWLEGTPKMAAYFHQLFTRACKYANQLVYPFESVSDYLQKNLELACQSAHHIIRAMDTSFFDFGKQVYISIQKNKEVCLYTYDLDQAQFRLIVIAESTAHDAFCDFIHYMAESNSKYLCSQEETLKRIKEYKSALLQMIIMSR